MEPQNQLDDTDPVSRVLRAARVRSAIYCRSELSAPWGFGVEAHGNPAFHVVTSGRCWLEVDGEPDHLALGQGDLVILPTGPRHWMRDDPATPAVALDRLLESTALDEHRRLSYGGGGPVTGLLCGGFALQNGDARPIFGALPPAVRIHGDGERAAPWLAATLDLLSAETSSPAPGAQEVVTRLADALLAQVLRTALVELHSSGDGRVLAIRDRQVAAAVGLIHDQPDRAWTVGELAGEVALSRSTFAARFREATGESPLRYLTRTRMAHAARLLRDSDASLAQVAARAGYSSEFSFGKAFKRVFGVAPGEYRGQEIEAPISLASRDGRI
jgi:AraC-like DNA-binding protein